MNKRICLVLLSLMFCFHLSFAGEVSLEKAVITAKNFYYERVSQYKDFNYQEIKTGRIVPESESGSVIYYGINMINGGYVLVSAEDATLPVLGYAFDGEYTGLDKPENFTAWMGQYAKTISWCRKNKVVAHKEISKEWERLSTANPASLNKFKSQKSVLPLIISNWDQGKYYNTQCPSDAQGPDGHALTGCVATAMGQIMYYYRWPEHGTGSYTYQHPNYGTITADFASATYDWDNMMNQLQVYNEGVAELLFHLGVSVDMNYGPTGSGMWNHHAALALGTYFKYLPSTQYVWRDTTNLDWDSLIIAHLDRGQILYYAGWSDYQYISGHAFVCDGYQDTSYCHFNWGWSGSYNGYFFLNALNPGGNNFNLVQELIINIYPDTLQYSYPNACQGNKTLHYLNGTLEDGSGPIADYENNLSCTWLIDPQFNPDDSVTSLTISFQKFDTEDGQDFITLYDGTTTSAPVLGTFSGSTLPATVTSSGNKVLVVFTTNNSISGKGWFLTYKSNLPDYCGTMTLTDPSGTISDGSGPKHYLESTLCTWSIQPPNAGAIILNFTDFDLEPVKDFVEVYDMATSQSLGKFSGNQLPPQVISPSGKMYIIFKTNGSVNRAGWSAQYTINNVGLENTNQLVSLLIFPNPAKEKIEFVLEGAPVKNYCWEILDVSAKKVSEGELTGYSAGNKEIIPVSHLKSGYYIFKVITDKGTISKSFTIL